MKTGAALGLQQQQGLELEGGMSATIGGGYGGAGGQGLPQRDVMDDLVDRLAALEDSH